MRTIKQGGYMNNRLSKGGRRLTQGFVAVILMAIIFDYGKHQVLRRTLEKEIQRSEGLMAVDSLSVSLWPLLQSHLVMKNFRLQSPKIVLIADQVLLRQGWRQDWRLVDIEATHIKSAEVVSVKALQGVLDTADLEARVKVSSLVLKGIEVNLPLLSFTGVQASFDFLYEIPAHNLMLRCEAPEMAFANGVSFGLKGDGNIHTHNPINGKMNLKIQNIDKMMKELAAAKVIESSQADLVMMGSNFLDKIGLHDVTLPLRIENEEVFLGPVRLFRMS
jgi:hypothetical protein